MKQPTPRTIVSAVYTPSAERTDGNENVIGDVTYVRFAECDHVMLGNPSMSYRVGTQHGCFQCTKEQS